MNRIMSGGGRPRIPWSLRGRPRVICYHIHLLILFLFDGRLVSRGRPSPAYRVDIREGPKGGRPRRRPYVRWLQDERDIESLGQRAAFSPPLHWHKVAFTGTVVYFLLRNHTNAVVCPTYVSCPIEGENQSHTHTSFEAAAIPGEIPPPIELAEAAPVLMLFLKERGKRMGLRDKERRRIYDPPHPNAQQDSPAVVCPSFFSG